MRLSLLVLVAILIAPTASAERRDCVDLPLQLACPPQSFPSLPRLPGVPGDPNVPGVPNVPPVPTPPSPPGLPPLPGEPPLPPDDLAKVCAAVPGVPFSLRPLAERLRQLGYPYLADDVEDMGHSLRQPGQRCAAAIG